MKKLCSFGRTCILILIVGNANADVITFDFTGRLTVFAPIITPTSTFPSTFLNDYQVITDPSSPSAIDPYGYQSSIGAQLTYDTNLGIGLSNLNIQLDPFLGVPSSIHDITLSRVSGTNAIVGVMLADYGLETNMPMQIVWDATGLINAIDYGLQVGDVISGDQLYRGGALELQSISSAIPWSEEFIYNHPIYGITTGFGQGPAPLATAAGTQGIAAGEVIEYIQAHIDIGSENSMEVTSISAIPIPATVWLFGSGLIGLISIARRKA